MMSGRTPRRPGRLAGVLALGVALDVGGTFLFWRTVPESAPLLVKPVDAAVVFMGDFGGDGRSLGPETLRRVNETARLYRRGLTREILCVGGSRPRRGVCGACLMKAALEGEGVPSQRIRIEPRSYDSQTNWARAAPLIRAHGWNRIAVVSSVVHLRRLRSIIESDRKGFEDIVFHPYSYADARPPMSWRERWGQAHYEAAAGLARLLPASWYRVLLRRLRQ